MQIRHLVDRAAGAALHRVAIGVLVLLRRLHVGGRCPGPVQRRGGEHRQIQPRWLGRFVEQTLQLWNARQAPVHALSLPALHRTGPGLGAVQHQRLAGAGFAIPGHALHAARPDQFEPLIGDVGAVCRHHQPVGSHRLGLRHCGTRAGKAQPRHAHAMHYGHGNPMGDGQRLKTFHGSHSFMHPARPVMRLYIHAATLPSSPRRALMQIQSRALEPFPAFAAGFEPMVSGCQSISNKNSCQRLYSKRWQLSKEKQIAAVGCGAPRLYRWLSLRTAQSPRLCTACTKKISTSTTASMISGRKRW